MLDIGNTIPTVAKTNSSIGNEFLQGCRVVRFIAGTTPGSPLSGKMASLPRESGGREFIELPASELRVLLEQVIASRGGGGGRNTIHREVVRLMGGNRLGVSAREHLARVEEMMAQMELI